MRTYVVKITCDACGREAPPQGWPPDARDRGGPPRDFVRIGLQELCTTCAGSNVEIARSASFSEAHRDLEAVSPSEADMEDAYAGYPKSRRR